MREGSNRHHVFEVIRAAGRRGIVSWKIIPLVYMHYSQQASVRAYRSLERWLGKKRKGHHREPSYEDQVLVGVKRQIRVTIWTLLRDGEIENFRKEGAYAVYRACK